MSARTEHPHAQVLRWIADGFDVEGRVNFGSLITDWKVSPPDMILCHLVSTSSQGAWEFRLSPAEPAQIEFLPALTEYVGVSQ